MRTQAEKYLLQYKVCTEKIFDLLEEAKNISYLQGISYDKPKVQSSKGQSNPTERQAQKLSEIDEEITLLLNKREEVAEVLKEVEDPIENFLLYNFMTTGSYKTEGIGPKEMKIHRIAGVETLTTILTRKGVI